MWWEGAVIIVGWVLATVAWPSRDRFFFRGRICLAIDPIVALWGAVVSVAILAVRCLLRGCRRERRRSDHVGQRYEIDEIEIDAAWEV